MSSDPQAPDGIDCLCRGLLIDVQLTAANLGFGKRPADKYQSQNQQTRTRDAATYRFVEVAGPLKSKRGPVHKNQEERLAIIPLNLDGYMFSSVWNKGYRQQILDRVAANFTMWKTDADQFERQLARVVDALTVNGARIPDPTPKQQ